MTYNFDPDRWYDSHRRILDARLASGELDEPAHAAAVAALDQRYDDMLQRLDGSYQIPVHGDNDDGAG